MNQNNRFLILKTKSSKNPIENNLSENFQKNSDWIANKFAILDSSTTWKELNLWKSTLQKGFLPQKVMIHFIKQPVNTQKSFYAMSKNKQYSFDVDPRLTKSQMKKLFEKLFGVNIVKIQTHLPPRKKIKVGNSSGSTQKTKRVIFTLKEGQIMKIN